MPTDEIERLHYYQKQYLGAADFEAQQQYHRDMRRRHNVGHHTWGIVTGLELVEKPNECDATAIDVFISPGMAVDGFGREIVVFEPVRIDPDLFDSFINLKHRAIWIAYDQHHTQFPKAGYQVCAKDDYARVEETYRIVIEPEPPPHDPVMIAGIPVQPPEIPADESVPEQEFPDDADEPLWLVCLGFVNWDGGNQKFVPATPEKAKDARRYVGLIGEQVIGPAGKLSLRDRTAPDPLPDDPAEEGYAGVAAEVEGSLQVDRLVTAKQDVQIHGGKLLLQNADGGDDQVPLWISRQKGPHTPGTADLRVHIGDAKIGEEEAGGSRLTVGNFESNGTDEAVILSVKGDNTVDIPTGTLKFGNTKRQMINLSLTNVGDPAYGIGVQGNTTYFRSHQEFSWFQDGVHSDSQGDPGGGVLQLRLNNGGLFFGEVTQQMLNLYGTDYGAGVQDATLYFRSNTQFCWFRHGIHSDAKSDPGGGTLLMLLDKDGSLSLTGGLEIGGDLEVGNDLSVGDDLTVDGNLRVKGNQDLIKVLTFTLDIQNGGVDSPAAWSVTHTDEFSQIYARYVALQGFNIFGPTLLPPQHNLDFGRHPQHVFVWLDDGGSDNNTTAGTCYCNQADSDEGNNHTLFTVVVMGKGVM